MKTFTIAWANVVRLVRDRSSIFFVFVFPLALVLLIGLQFGGSFAPKMGVFAGESGPEAEKLVERLTDEARLEVVAFKDESELITAVERGGVAAALVIPAGYDRGLRSGEAVEVGFVARPDGSGASLQVVVSEALADATKEVAATRFLVEQGLADFEGGANLVASIAPALNQIEVSTRTIGDSLFPSTLGQFDLGASSQLILFMFITALSGAAVLIQTRQLGLSRRMLSTPTEVRTIVIGEGLGRFGVVLVQGIYIMVATLLAFRVNWGDPVGAIAVLIVFSAVGAGAAMLMGSVFSNAEQAGGVAVTLGLGLAALGGCMLPMELFSPTLRRVAHITPHAWAVDAFAELVQRGGRIGDILPQLGVLLGYALVLVLLATWRLRIAITRN
ncbi:MAG TPA: ABC transporter permease [Acidimicrobiia bacterium]|nr:ABC transporter permease [Acidimicrobiia bacterium]